MLFAAMEVPDGEEIAPGRTLQPKVEGEVAFVLGRDLTEPEIGMTDLLRAVEFVLPAIEVVDSRIAGWDIRIADTVADNASSGVFVLGQRPVRPADFDPLSCAMTMQCNGQLVSSGAGMACLGSLWNALLWLARKLVESNRALGAGDVVLSGALGPTVPATPGDRFEARIEGLGTVRAVFGKN